jgi:hypothetical protein
MVERLLWATFKMCSEEALIFRPVFLKKLTKNSLCNLLGVFYKLIWGQFFVHFFPQNFPRKIPFFPTFFGGKFSVEFSTKFSPEKMYEKSAPGHSGCGPFGDLKVRAQTTEVLFTKVRAV